MPTSPKYYGHAINIASGSLQNIRITTPNVSCALADHNSQHVVHTRGNNTLHIVTLTVIVTYTFVYEDEPTTGRCWTREVCRARLARSWFLLVSYMGPRAAPRFGARGGRSGARRASLGGSSKPFQKSQERPGGPSAQNLGSRLHHQHEKRRYSCRNANH